jgi:hypothetical protein
VYTTLVGRRVATNQEYDAVVRIFPAGSVNLTLSKLNGSATASNIGSAAVVSGLTYTAGTRLNARFQVSGTSPTTVRAKVWAASGSEPSAWTVSSTDTSTGLQAAGSVGLKAYLSSSATNVPITVSVTAFAARPVA